MLFCLLAKEARTKQGESGALVVKRCNSKPPVSAQAVARGAARSAPQVFDRGAQAVTCGAARCASQVLDLGVQAVASYAP